MKSLLVCVLLVTTAHAKPDAKTTLHRFFDEEWEWGLRMSPDSATMLGDRRFDAELPDLSAASIAAQKAHLEQRLAKARSFDPKVLDEADRLSLELFITSAARNVELAKFPSERLAVGPTTGPQADLPSLAQVPAFKTDKQLGDYLSRIKKIPRYIDQTIALLEVGRTTGWVRARETMVGVPKQIRDVADVKPEASVFYEPLAKSAHAMEARDVIDTQIRPAFDKLAAYIETTYLPATRKDAGVWSLPDGVAYYAACVRGHTTTKKTPDEIHALGLSEVARIRGEMDALIKTTGFTGTRTAFNTMLRTDARFFYKDGRELLRQYRDIAKRIDGALPKLFGKLPRLPYGVIPTPAQEGPTQTTAYYREGSLEDGRAGNFVANLYKPETRPTWEMEALTLHEAVPGHHLQLALQQELTDLPKFRREGDYTAFVEGWGLYAESLGPELGMFQDPYAKYGQLTYEMWRAVRLVVDTGIHAKHWTRQQAIDFFLENTAKTPNDIGVEVDRYIGWPGQALAYKIGELEMKRLRAYAQDALGSKFDIRRFHEAVLAAGAVPLDVLDRRIRAFVEAERR